MILLELIGQRLVLAHSYPLISLYYPPPLFDAGGPSRRSPRASKPKYRWRYDHAFT
jgi:hypothetical protein